MDYQTGALAVLLFAESVRLTKEKDLWFAVPIFISGVLTMAVAIGWLPSEFPS